MHDDQILGLQLSMGMTLLRTKNTTFQTRFCSSYVLILARLRGCMGAHALLRHWRHVKLGVHHSFGNMPSKQYWP